MKIIIIGSGVVGQATGKGLAEKGHEIIFVDTKPSIISQLTDEGYDARLPSQIEQIEADISMFSVSVPAKSTGAVELGHIEAAMLRHAAWLDRQEKWHLVVVRSTVPPGTTRGRLCSILQTYHKKVGKDFGLCMQPEFLREKTGLEDFRHPWVILIGEYDKRSGDVLESLYRDFGGSIYRVSIETAEMEKYAHNLYNATKISFTNEIYRVCARIDLDGNEIMELVSQSAEGMWNPQYGTKGGYPFGGTCLPKDTSGFLTYARAKGLLMPLLEAVVEVNNSLLTEHEMTTVAEVKPQ